MMVGRQNCQLIWTEIVASDVKNMNNVDNKIKMINIYCKIEFEKCI